jgi:diguanylate cyclase (GGDEF)-like protein/PAS domain S-box-containing protein
MCYEAGEPSDFIYLEVNGAFEKLTGLTGVRGKYVSEVIPGLRASNPELFEIYGRVASTGNPEKFETYVDALGIWFAISVYSPRPEHFVAVFDNITERKRVEAALAEEQYLLHALLEAVPDYIYFKDTESRFIRTSKAHAKAFGLSDPALAIGKSDFDFFTREHANQAYEDEQEIIRTGQPISKEEKETWKDRPDTWVLTTKMPLRDRQGKIIGTFGISKDISERKQSEEKVQRNEAMLRAILDQLPSGVTVRDASSGELLLSNARSREIMSNLVDTPAHFSQYRGFYPDGSPYRNEDWPLFRSLFTGEMVKAEEVIYERGDETRIVLSINSAPIRDSQGRIIMAVSVFDDITGRKQAEEGLRRFQLLSEHSRDIILFMRHTDSRILEANAAAIQAYGYSHDELLALTIQDLRAHNTHSLTAEQMAQASTTGILFETVHLRKDGSTFPVEVSSQGAIIGGIRTLISVVRDITERKQVEADQQNYTIFLESLNNITRIVLEAQDLESTLKILVENIAKLFEADDAFFTLWDEDTKLPIPMIAYGSMSEVFPKLRFEPGEKTLVAAVMEFEHPLAVPDLQSSPYCSPKVAAMFPSRSMLGIPLIVQGNKVASLCLGYNNIHHFDQEEISYAESVAQQIALVLTKIQLLDEAQRRIKQLTVLHEIAVISTQVDTIDRLIESATEIIGKNVFPDNFGVLLMDEEKGVLRPHSSYQFISEADFVPTDVPLGRGITGQVAQTGQPIRIGNVEGLKNYLNVDPSISSELCVPIRLKDRVLGVINAESTRPEAFSPDDELLLGTLAGQLATAIEQLRAVQAERQWLDQLAHANDLIYAIAHITTHIEKALTQEEIIQTLGRELNNIDFSCIMAVYDKDRNQFRFNYTSIAPNALEQMEAMLGYPLIQYTFPLEKLHAVLKINEPYRPEVVTNAADEIQLLFTQRREKGVPELLQGLGAAPDVELLRLPLQFEENLLGILWLWGKGLTKTDLPIMSIFAKQIGSSLERARLFQEVQSLALTDPLTGLQNRRSLFELGRIEFARSKRANRHFSCLMLDVDHFKHINDNYGHAIGDEVLREFAQRSKNSVREVDIIGRYGGEELVIFLPETDLKTAKLVAERLRSSIEKTPVSASNRELNMTISVGVAAKDENTCDLETLIARADQAMYIAKYRGRNRVAISK